MKTFHLLPESEIQLIESMDKKDRVIFVGKLMQKDKGFAKKLETGFNDVVNQFISENKLDREDDITDIRRDAVYVVNKPILHPKIGECNFIAKNRYHGFIRCSSLEFLFRDDGIDVKGLNDVILPKFEMGPLSMIQDIYDACSEFRMNRFRVNQYFKRLLVAYKQRELPLEYYREFNSTARFKLNMYGKVFLSDDVSESDIDFLDISYNYLNILIPLIRTLC